MTLRATLYRYRVPFAPDGMLKNADAHREGVLVHLVHGEREGWGEIAPLPKVSREKLNQAITEAQQVLQGWHAKPDKNVATLDQVTPSVAFGVSCALAELKQELPEAMATDAALLGSCASIDNLIKRLASRPGYRLAKIKVGRDDPVKEGQTIAALLDEVPRLSLRLDANSAWTLGRAMDFSAMLNPALRQRVAFIEDPCRTPDLSRSFAAKARINIAWDEHLRDEGFAIREEPWVSAIVIKPTLVGSLARCNAWIDVAHRHGLAAVISSSFESSLGLTQLSRFAAWRTPDTAPGLDTANALLQQVLRPYPDCAHPLVGADDLEDIWRL